MGYDLHIVRTREWVDAEQNPITKGQVDALIATDPDLLWSDNDYLDMRNPFTKEIIRIPGLFFESKDEVFWLHGGEITCKNPSEALQFKMIRLAKKLGAMVIGDEDELYRIHKTFFGKEKIVVEPITG